MRTITFQNQVQLALFKCELSGQISDGYWENSVPHNHWRWIVNLKMEVDADHPGMDFNVNKKYDFAAPVLLKVVGDRMLRIANMAENNIPVRYIDQFNDYDPNNNYEGQYWKDKKEIFFEAFGSEENFRKACTGSYDMKKLKHELIMIKAIVDGHAIYNHAAQLKTNNIPR